MIRRGRIWQARALFGALLLALFAVPSYVMADRYESTNYVVDASTMNNFGGTGSSSSYGLVSSGGESIIGSGNSTSYKMGAGYVAQLAGQAPSIQLAVQPSDLIAYYPLDESSGEDVYDAGINEIDGITENSPGWDTGKIGEAIDLNSASNQRIDIPDNASYSGSELTVTMWAYQNSDSTNRGFISHWHHASQGSWALQTSGSDDSKLSLFVANGLTDPGNNYAETQTGAWTSGEWHHVAFVYDGSLANSSRVKIYIDGSPANISTTGTIVTSLENASTPIKIGDFYGLNRYWNGLIDHVKLYSRALTAEEIESEYNAQDAGYSSGLTLGTVTAGVSNTVTYDAIVETTANNYSLAVEQDGDLTKGSDTIPAVSGSIASPAAWSEGTTKGLGFTLVSGVSIPGAWNSGNSYAAIPNTSTSFYTRTGYTPGTREALGMRLRLDTAVTQAIGTYSNVMTVTGTATP